MLPAVRCSDITVAMKRPSTVHPIAERTVCSARLVGKGSIVGYYYGFVGYKNLGSCGSCLKMYGESIAKVTKEIFLKWANHPPEKAADRDIVEHPF